MRQSEYNSMRTMRRANCKSAAYRLQLQRYQNELTQLRYLLTEAPSDEQQELTQRVFQVSGLGCPDKTRARCPNVLIKSDNSFLTICLDMPKKPANLLRKKISQQRSL